MNTIVFNGCWVGTDVVGVSRYAYNLVCEIDRILVNRNEDINIEIVVPQSADITSLKLRKIKIVKVGDFKSKFEKIQWEQVTFPLYLGKNKAVGVDLTLSLPILGTRYIAIHDCIYESFPENYKGHEIHRFMYLWKVKRIAKNKKKTIITVSNESKKEIVKYYGIQPERIIVGY